MADILRMIRDTKDVREAIDYVRSLSSSELLWIYERIGLDKPPGAKNAFAAGKKRKRRILAGKVPIEVHAAIMAKLWPNIYRDHWPPRRPMNVTTAAEAVAAMEKRAAAGKGLWHPSDQVEITDRKRLFHRQGHQFAPGDSTRRKNGRCKYKPTLSKMMSKAAASLSGSSRAENINENGEIVPVIAKAKSVAVVMFNHPHVIDVLRNTIVRRVPKLANLEPCKRQKIVRDVCEKLTKMRAGKNGKVERDG